MVTPLLLLLLCTPAPAQDDGGASMGEAVAVDSGGDLDTGSWSGGDTWSGMDDTASWGGDTWSGMDDTASWGGGDSFSTMDEGSWSGMDDTGSWGASDTWSGMDDELAASTMEDGAWGDAGSFDLTSTGDGIGASLSEGALEGAGAEDFWTSYTSDEEGLDSWELASADGLAEGTTLGDYLEGGEGNGEWWEGVAGGELDGDVDTFDADFENTGYPGGDTLEAPEGEMVAHAASSEGDQGAAGERGEAGMPGEDGDRPAGEEAPPSEYLSPDEWPEEDRRYYEGKAKELASAQERGLKDTTRSGHMKTWSVSGAAKNEIGKVKRGETFMNSQGRDKDGFTWVKIQRGRKEIHGIAGLHNTVQRRRSKDPNPPPPTADPKGYHWVFQNHGVAQNWVLTTGAHTPGTSRQVRKLPPRPANPR